MNDRTLENNSWLRRAPIWLGLAVIVGLSWLYLVHMSTSMSGMPRHDLDHGACMTCAQRARPD